MLRRRIAEKLLEMTEKYPAVTLTGPRQSGKTTLVKNLFPEYSYVSLEDPDTLARAKDDPNSFLDRYSVHTIFDEAQRFPELFSYLQSRIDSRRETGQYIISGSQNFQLLDAISQSLAGRVAVLVLPPFSFREVVGTEYEPASIDAWVFNGGYPRLYDYEINPADYYPSYIQTYLERDIRKELGIVKIAEFERFLKLCALRTGELLNMSELARDCGVSEKTAAGWLSALESSYLVYLLQPYHSNRGKRLIKTPKLYFNDSGLACNLMGIESAEDLMMHEKRGALFETAVIAEIAKHYLAIGRTPKIYFWRDTNGNEIDAVLEKGTKPAKAFEIKSSKTYNGRYFDTLEKIARSDLSLEQGDYSVVYGGSETIATKRGDLLALPDLDGRL